VGSSDVVIDTKDGEAYTGKVTLDQYGAKYTGINRITGTVDINNLAGSGDVLNLTGMFSEDNMKFGSISYDRLMTGKGMHLGASYAALNYRLGRDLLHANASGTARTASVWLKQPLLRSLDNNATVQLKYDINELKDRVATTFTKTDRTLSTASVSVSGDVKNSKSLGGTTYWSLGIANGQLAFDDANAEADDALAAQAKGSFIKTNMNVSHLQYLSKKGSVYVNIAAQLASNNLDSSLKMATSGVKGVRAYSTGTPSGDEGYLVNLELRYHLTKVAGGSLIGTLFYDAAEVTVNKKPWLGAGTNKAALSGAGFGLNWLGPDKLSGKVLVGAPTGSATPLVTSDPEYTVWFELNQGF
jgi:hemolysin activation/secretion protein